MLILIKTGGALVLLMVAAYMEAQHYYSGMVFMASVAAGLMTNLFTTGDSK